MAFVWLGDTRLPIGAFALLPLWAVGSASSMVVPDPTPFTVPASSPDVREISVRTVHVGRFRMRTFDEHVLPSAYESMPRFGNGVGTVGPGGAGTWQTSGTLAAT